MLIAGTSTEISGKAARLAIRELPMETMTTLRRVGFGISSSPNMLTEVQWRKTPTARARSTPMRAAIGDQRCHSWIL